ncbi:unnamed protein product, partial [Polarella glacialis]
GNPCGEDGKDDLFNGDLAHSLTSSASDARRWASEPCDAAEALGFDVGTGGWGLFALRGWEESELDEEEDEMLFFAEESSSDSRDR